MNRRPLRVSAAAWLFIQLLSLLAFAPLDCCERHEHGSARAKTVAAPEPECHRAAAPVDDKCRMSSSCEGPSAALLSVLSNHGILPLATAVLIQPASRHATIASDARTIRLSLPPDAPPPRA